jgi:hypothetical protein
MSRDLKPFANRKGAEGGHDVRIFFEVGLTRCDAGDDWLLAALNGDASRFRLPDMDTSILSEKV